MSEQDHTAGTPSGSWPEASSTTPSALVARGFALFPLRAGSKLPAVARDWEHVATTSLVRLRRLTSDPRANYGVACGPSNLVVIDLDVAREAGPGEPTHGLRVLRELAGEQGVPRTFTVGTPSGGRHLYFRPPVDGPAPRNTVRRLGPLIDTRGVGGYVVAPGSRVDGVAYRILEDAPIAELPEWIGTLLRPLEPRPASGEPLPLSTALGPVGARLGGAYARTALEREAARVEAARVGTRNDTLNRAAYSLGTLVGSGVLEEAVVEAELTRAALAAGLDARETAGTVRSGLTAGMARPRRLVGVGASAAASGVGAFGVAAAGVRRLRLDEASEPAAPSRTLIPTRVPQPADWPRFFGSLGGLGAAVSALRHELAASAPGFTLPSETASHGTHGGARNASEPGVEDEPGPGRQHRWDTPSALVALLDEFDAAYDQTARAGGTLAGSARWLGIQTLADLLRDLRDELEAEVEADAAGMTDTADTVDGSDGSDAADAAEPIPAEAFALVRALTAVAARRIMTLAEEIAVKLGTDGLRRSPLGNALRRTRHAAEALAVFGHPPAPLTPTRFATGRGALQAQLAAMRRDLRAAAERPAA
jgi:hypothetical protein